MFLEFVKFKLRKIFDKMLSNECQYFKTNENQNKILMS